MMRDNANLIEIGIIVRPHGIRGELKVIPSTIWPPAGSSKLRVLLKEGSVERWITLDSVREQKGALFVRIPGVSDRDTAERLRNARLFLHRDKLPPLGEDDYFIDDLIGLKAITASGDEIGPVTGVFNSGAHDIYIIMHSGNEIMIPAVKAFVKKIDLSAGIMIIEPVEGLLNIDEN